MTSNDAITDRCSRNDTARKRVQSAGKNIKGRAQIKATRFRDYKTFLCSTQLSVKFIMFITG